MQVAIVGAGFAGLSLAWHLGSLGRAHCTIFDAVGIGAGASGIASGLLHPFPAAATQYSFMGREALHESISLLQVAQQHTNQPVASKSGVWKLAMSDEDKKHFSSLSYRYERLQWYPQTSLEYIKNFPALLLENGVTVFCKAYLQGLWEACKAGGASFVREKVQDLSTLSSFDIVVACAGSGITELDPTWKLQTIKGQIVECKMQKQVTARSVIAKGYIAVTADPLVYHVGSTYEHHYTNALPEIETAKNSILPKCRTYLPCIDEAQIIGCKAAIRVASAHAPLPIIKRYTSKRYAMTAFGSRGLLYHGLLGKQLARALVFEDMERISREFFIGASYT